ncbi:unnamed protein product, partial [Amoebophrya sp. A120]|eukprot:GSA120T00025571001.1
MGWRPTDFRGPNTFPPAPASVWVCLSWVQGLPPSGISFPCLSSMRHRVSPRSVRAPSGPPQNSR